jgi:ligand-binding sensor domain-containing protein
VPLRVLLLAALLLVGRPASAQLLSLHTYDARDGLVAARVNDIHQCASGYVWVATADGLLCFDGYRFTNYGAEQGLLIVSEDMTNSPFEQHMGVAYDPVAGKWTILNGTGALMPNGRRFNILVVKTH